MTRKQASFSLLAALGLALASAPHAGAVAALQPPGRILSSSGAAYGGIIGFNADGTNYINYTPDNFGENNRQNKSEHPSISRDGTLIAFDSNRNDASGTTSGNASHIFVINGDGTGTRQLTFKSALGDGTPTTDFSPEMSPDGKEIAFISNRGDQRNVGPTEKGSPYAGTTDAWVINTDGTNLHQVTFAEPHQDNYGDTVYSSAIGGLAWGVSSHTLAFKGHRLSSTPNQSTGVVGFVNDDGTGYHILSDFGNTKNFGPAADAAFDWSPNGRYIAAPYGDGNGYYGQLVIFDLQSGTATSLPGKDSNGKTSLPFSTAGGALRFSPDSTRLITDTGPNGEYNIQYTYDLSGNNRVMLNVPLVRDAALCWASGPVIPKPDHLTVTPSPVYVPVGGTVHLIPTLYDAQNNVIVHAVSTWNQSDDGSFSISTLGDLTATRTAPYGPLTIAPNNGGVTAPLTYVVVGVPKIVATLTQLSRDGSGNIVAGLTLTNTGDGSAPQPRLDTATLGGVPASAGMDAIGDAPGPLPFYIVPPGFYGGSFVPGKSLNITLTFPAASLGPKGTRAVLRFGGDYIVGTFNSSLRVTLP